MFAQLRPAIVMIALFTLLTGLAYPLAVTGVAQLLLPAPAQGSLLRDAHGRVVGSALIGQAFAGAQYLHPRPSAAGNGYDPLSSGGSNYGPLDPKLASRVAGDASTYEKADGSPAAIPADAVTASGSGLDPDISPDNARIQAGRIAAARHVSPAAVQAIIDRQTQGRTLFVLGEPHVNVLLVNRALDAQFGAAGSASRSGPSAAL